MSKPVITVENLSKEYQIGEADHRHDSFREMLTGSLGAPFRRLRKLGGQVDDEHRFWALKDVSFTVRQGEVLGIIGRNGAGKSTLLKILSRISSPTEGRVTTSGRVASLLEVGTGFHPELTGRENIYLNGAILGMSRAEIRVRFDEIVAFSEVEKFLDTPVKRYSSGMHVRLAFSVAAHMEPEILLVDEVLAVGDAEFQKRCLGKMSSVAGEGRTVLFVSHNLSAVGRLCSRGVVLSQGRLLADAAIRDALAVYATDISSRGSVDTGAFFGPLSDRLRFTEIRINDSPVSGVVAVNPLRPIRISAEGVADEAVPHYRTTFGFRRDGHHILSLHDGDEPYLLPAGPFRAEVTLPAEFLGPGDYAIELGAYSVGGNGWTWGRDQALMSLVEAWSPTYDTRSNMGTINISGTGKRLVGSQLIASSHTDDVANQPADELS